MEQSQRRNGIGCWAVTLIVLVSLMVGTVGGAVGGGTVAWLAVSRARRPSLLSTAARLA
jgi:hypothetical protein